MNSSHSQTCRLYPTVCTGHEAPATAILVSLMAGSRYNRLPSRCWVQTNSCRSTFHPTRSHRSTGLALDPRPKWRLSNEMLQKPSPFRVWAKGASFRQLDSSDLSLLPAGYEVKHGETDEKRAARPLFAAGFGCELGVFLWRGADGGTVGARREPRRAALRLRGSSTRPRSPSQPQFAARRWRCGGLQRC